MCDASAQYRKELIRRCRSRGTRRREFSPERPTNWHPTSLIDPATGDPFTGDSCWTFVADAMEAGAPIEVMVLKKPPGKRGFVLKLAGHKDETIYVKLQLLSEVVLGRSFHISGTGHDEDE